MPPSLCLLDVDSVSYCSLPIAPVPASCGYTGFPSPAQDYTENWTTLDQYFNVNPNTTWFFKAEGYSMQDVGITAGDVLLVDSAAQPVLGDICIVIAEGEYMAKILDKIDGKWALVSANECYPPVFVDEISVFGVVTGVAHRFRR